MYFAWSLATTTIYENRLWIKPVSPPRKAPTAISVASSSWKTGCSNFSNCYDSDGDDNVNDNDDSDGEDNGDDSDGDSDESDDSNGDDDDDDNDDSDGDDDDDDGDDGW